MDSGINPYDGIIGRLDKCLFVNIERIERNARLHNGPEEHSKIRIFPKNRSYTVVLPIYFAIRTMRTPPGKLPGVKFSGRTRHIPPAKGFAALDDNDFMAPRYRPESE